MSKLRKHKINTKNDWPQLLRFETNSKQNPDRYALF